MNVTHDRDSRLFLVHESGQRAFLYYEIRNGAFDVKSTFVPQPIRGRGVGLALARAASRHAAEHGLTVIATCSYFRHLQDSGRLAGH